jgi:hypothetical protein
MTQCLHDRICFFAKEHEISGDCSFAAPGRLEINGGRYPRAGGTVIAFSMIVWELTTNLPFALPGVKLPHFRAIAAQLHAAPAATVVLAGI